MTFVKVAFKLCTKIANKSKVAQINLLVSIEEKIYVGLEDKHAMNAIFRGVKNVRFGRTDKLTWVGQKHDIMTNMGGPKI